MGIFAPETPLAGLHHLTLTVSDLDASLDWYARVLGFRVVGRAEVDGMRKALMHRPDAFSLSFVEHDRTAGGDRFDERRIGLDHVSFGLPDLDALHAWIAMLDRHDVTHSQVTAATWGSVVSFRDPDGIALEFYTR
ncbi:VOC family protein [Gordonia desulfuricans]|uniref:VOC family protein n=1 Tax=Gordonia desulfuricans TaxID=89051 RepID=UPI000B022ACD|nr:VOC family protein [Gordonia desulfuricans]